MTHLRDDIREACVAALVAAGTAAGSRVHDHPYDPRVEFPALVVEDEAEQQVTASMPADAGRPIERLYALAVTAEVRQIAGYARQRGSLLAQVEAALAAAALPGVKSLQPAGYQALQSNDGDQPIAAGRQRFEILYYTPQGAPATAL